MPTCDLLRLLAKYRIALRAELDQEHIIDSKLIDQLIDLAEVDEDDIVLEVGPGIGNITELMAARARRVYAVERHRQFERILRDRLGGKRNVEILFCNILSIRLPTFNKLVSNLPFSICEGFLQKLIHSEFELGALIVPLSFARVVVAKPDDPEASKLSILASAFFEAEVARVIEPEAFHPAPRFKCAMLKLAPYDTRTRSRP